MKNIWGDLYGKTEDREPRGRPAMKTLAVAFGLSLFAMPVSAQTRPTGEAWPQGTPPTPGAAPAPPTCNETFLQAKPGEVTLSSLELEAICDEENEGALLKQVKLACYSKGKEAAEMAADQTRTDEFITARKNVCTKFPQIAGTSDLDLVARVYRASNPRLPKPPGHAAPPAQPVSPAPAQSGSGTYIERQGITGTMVAQTVGSFLVARAEKEVSAFATVELFSRLCRSETKGVLPETCALLEGQENGGLPFGLGLLQRTVESDLRNLPKSLLKNAYERIQKHPQKESAKLEDAASALCIADVGAALVTALTKPGGLGDIHSAAPTNTVAQLKRHSVLASYPACNSIWEALDTRSVETGELYQSIQELNLAKSPDAQRTARAKVIQAAVDVAEEMFPASVPDTRRPLEETGEIFLAIWNADWPEAVRAAASAETLGQYLLCKPDKTDCQRDEKIRLVLSIGADLALARSSDEVQATLNRVVEPVGSWRRKFQDTFTLTLQGYVGGKAAYESVAGPASSGISAAPVIAVGIEPSFSYSSTGRIGLFLQVLDVGNFASIHLAGEDDDSAFEVEAAPNISVAQLFSPGAYAVWTPAKMPFVLGAGVNWVPGLRETPDGARAVWQVGGFLAVDVPILELVHE